MSSKWRRFEVLLPLRFNDGRDVPPEQIVEAVLELADHFGAVSHETQRVEGHWRQGDAIYRDSLVKLVIDLPDIKKNRAWMLKFKQRWKSRLEQVELWMTSHRIEIE